MRRAFFMSVCSRKQMFRIHPKFSDQKHLCYDLSRTDAQVNTRSAFFSADGIVNLGQTEDWP
ncbi:uncharacterized protein BO96DRAFT_13601 [Aspergillus niger CBS 101883]|uniref:uncharacterized protein n=1 Tax=Aspergillus lacticoffeatus (strain CBS 101883) TaxID=1450533 RepID=UPI000D7F9531|nr:uncharacterized protein BO96DRAFT_13601 [Aspergillus niger CBS 101883]PYH62438.1 hypothetical protein BO96DRAFT_13601 [Aspergillus niger CBS 101883]